MTTIQTESIGEMLRGWRQRRKLSQLELSASAEVSSRHLSFLETGRSQPSREMIERLSEQLDVPLRERNQMLLSAGFAPQYAHRGFNSPELLSISRAFSTILDAHLPNPALVLDRWWDVVDRNSATDILLDGCAAELLDPPVNAIRLTLHPDGLASRISNLGQWRAHLLTQLRSRFARTGDDRLRRLLEEVLEYPGENAGTPARTDVVVPLQLRVGATELSFFSIAASVESATDITIDELQIEAFYPADEATLNALRIS